MKQLLDILNKIGKFCWNEELTGFRYIG